MTLADDIARLEKRVSALERHSVTNTETIGWLASTLGGMKATQDGNTQRLERIETDVGELKASLKGLRDDLPKIVGDVMREVLKEPR